MENECITFHYEDCDESCSSMGRSRRSTLFKSLELQDRYQELNVRVAQMEKKVTQLNSSTACLRAFYVWLCDFNSRQVGYDKLVKGF